jgi:hypothetical protein
MKQGTITIAHEKEPRAENEAAPEIADDEVEIGKTGGKSTTESTPLTKRKP